MPHLQGGSVRQGDAKPGGVGERQRAVPRRVNVRCCLAASWARASADLFNPIWRGGGEERGGALPEAQSGRF